MQHTQRCLEHSTCVCAFPFQCNLGLLHNLGVSSHWIPLPFILEFLQQEASFTEQHNALCFCIMTSHHMICQDALSEKTDYKSGKEEIFQNKQTFIKLLAVWVGRVASFLICLLTSLYFCNLCDGKSCHWLIVLFCFFCFRLHYFNVKAWATSKYTATAVIKNTNL